jgi:hypothetical protein
MELNELITLVIQISCGFRAYILKLCTSNFSLSPKNPDGSLAIEKIE